ncbi:phage recombination protein Bet [Streptomyces sp. NBC_01506]|uniref:phage recombination protein Bet n=1 Tax=Streptomyces sp. NBC_01506 TaxID=2903887 RepID=UPI003866D500
MSTEIATAGGSLAIRPDQTNWTPDQQAVLMQSGIDNQVAPAELSAFLHLCQRTRLDPFSRQIYLIGRWNGQQQRKVYTPQTSIDGYRVIAHRAAAEASHSLGYEDTLWCDPSGKWRDVWLDDKPPAAAKVTVIRNGMRFSAVARYSEYVQTKKGGEPSGLWVKMPTTMTAKCAEALALRMAFPHDLAGVYTAEEMAQADNPAPAERHLRQVQPGETDQWSTPAPGQAATPQREFLREALDAPDAAAVRLIWMDARTEGARPEYLGQIAAVGKEKAAAAPQPAAAESASADDVVDGEVVSPEDEYAAAVAELRAAAEAARLEDFETGAEQALGMPITDASVDAIRALAVQLRNAA